jgi:OOP family OmpA-OmpF porin
MGRNRAVAVSLALAFGAVPVFAAMPAQAANHGFYVSFDAGAVDQEVSGPFTAVPLGGILGLGGPTAPDQSPDIGWALFGEAGLRLGSSFRIEAEVGYRASTLSSLSDIDHLTFMGNLLYDIPIGDRFSVAIGGGVGLDRIAWTGDYNLSYYEWKAAAQGIASASFRLSERASFDLKYRYMVPTSPGLMHLVAIDGSGGQFEFTGEDVSTHTLALGLTFQLD